MGFTSFLGYDFQKCLSGYLRGRLSGDGRIGLFSPLPSGQLHKALLFNSFYGQMCMNSDKIGVLLGYSYNIVPQILAGLTTVPSITQITEKKFSASNQKIHYFCKN